MTHEEMVRLYEQGKLDPCDYCANNGHEPDEAPCAGCDFFDCWKPNAKYREATGTKEARRDALSAGNIPSSWCWGGERGKCAWLDIGLDGGWPDAKHKCTCPDKCREDSWFKEDTPHE